MGSLWKSRRFKHAHLRELLNLPVSCAVVSPAETNVFLESWNQS